MQRSSETIGAIASALAKAQGELTNPEKSLVATIYSPFPREGERSFRYASLASGLDIVRKHLGQHEIATIQSTTIDHEVGQIRLTTMLAHASGEWIASDWPVCLVNDTASPHRMGAALTYARRYALFTLVGIAGEDDLDAPDLIAVNESPNSTTSPRTVDSETSQPSANRKIPRGRLHKPVRAMLMPEASKILGEELQVEIAAIDTADNLARWAYRRLPVKNTLTVEDARNIERIYESRLQSLASTMIHDLAINEEAQDAAPPISRSKESMVSDAAVRDNTGLNDQSTSATADQLLFDTGGDERPRPIPGGPPPTPISAPAAKFKHTHRVRRRDTASEQPAAAGAAVSQSEDATPHVGTSPTAAEETPPYDATDGPQARELGWSQLLCKPIRRRNKAHLSFVAAQPCLICHRLPCDAHHLKFAQVRALGRKVSDEFTVPLCRDHHRQLHLHGNELSFWANVQLAPLEVAEQLWAITTNPSEQNRVVVAGVTIEADDANPTA